MAIAEGAHPKAIQTRMGHKWGRLLRFDPNEIEAWLDEARRPSTAG